MRLTAAFPLLALLAATFVTAAGPSASERASCTFSLGFRALHDLIPDVVGGCSGDETHNPTNGDALQPTTNGLLVWRKADNWTAFTDGTFTWINGPLGLQKRGNQERFDWEPPGEDAVLVAAGDIAGCNTDGDEATAALLDTIPGVVAALGDNVYEQGSLEEYQDCYAPSWGRHKARTRPTPGNHEYLTPGAAGYFSYFGDAAGASNFGYYSYELGTWHVSVLNSNCREIGGCGVGSPQERWLRADLVAHPSRCSLAYWHHAGFFAGTLLDPADLRPLWQALYDAGTEVVLAGHIHEYERLAPQDPAGRADPARGIRHFTVGSGGYSHFGLPPMPNSEAHDEQTFGVLKLTLHEAGYDWQFIPIAGQSFTDGGSGVCH